MSVDTLTDSELRTKLAEYGYPVGPVTQTTRKILVKKLKNLMESRGGAGSRHSLAARYSSDETDEDTITGTVRKRKGAASSSARRQTMANPMPPPAPSTSLSGPIVATSTNRSPAKRRAATPASASSAATADARETNSHVAPIVEDTSSRSLVKSVQKILTNKVKRTEKTIADGLETGSDSDVNDEAATRNYYAAKWQEYKTRERNSVEPDAREATTTRDEKNEYNAPPFKLNISPILPVKDDTTNKKEDLRVDSLLANYETPYLSDFTRRLSTRSSIGVASPSRNTTKSTTGRSSAGPEVKDSDTNGHFSALRSTYSLPSASARYASGVSYERASRDVGTSRPTYKTGGPSGGKEETRNNHNLISMVLLIVLALFFAVLAVVYLGLGGKTDSFPALPSDSNVPLCLMSDHDKPGVNCLLKENLENVVELLQKLRPIMARRAIGAACENSDEKPYISDNEIVELFRSEKTTKLEVTSDLHNAHLLIFSNPKWGISLIEIGDDAGQSYSILDSMEKVFQTRLDGNLGMLITSPELPMRCHVMQKLFAVLTTLAILIIGTIFCLAGHRLVLWYLKHKKSAEREVFQLVSEIISMVEMHHQSACTTSPGGTQESYLAINHVRDNLIPPKDRKKMATLWDKAVKFLDENESRIRREVQQVAGEEFHVWRWLPNNIMNTSSSASPIANKRSKVWQGQAFETIEGSVNSLSWSPTPCLKIRHMFDPDVEFEENWETRVQDAVLEKCGEAVKVLHIRVDRGNHEGCVYMMCMSKEDAGKACRALHGCWFDGKLVTVKYLRLERYYKRFPEAARSTTPIKPSNNDRLSLQCQSRLASLEAN